MNITYLHTLPRQLGCKTFAVWFLLACAEQENLIPVSHRWLLDHMPAQTSPNSITAALRYLCDPENQIAIRVTGGWRLTSAIQLPLELSTGAVDNFHQNRAERDSYPSSSSSNRKEKKTFVNQEEEESEIRAERDSHSENFASCHSLLKANKIGEPKATQLASLHHVTPEFIQSHLEAIKDSTLTIGTALYRIEHNWGVDTLPPAPPKPRKIKNDGQRYVEGEYADYINKDT